MTQTPYRLIWHWRHLCSHHTDTLHAHTDVIYDQGTLTSLHSHHTDALYAHIIPAPFIFTSHWRSITLTSHRRALCSRPLTPFTLKIHCCILRSRHNGSLNAYITVKRPLRSHPTDALHAHITLTPFLLTSPWRPFTLTSHWRPLHSHHPDALYASITLTPFTLTSRWRPLR